ncbi:hypothetical protein [Dyella lutea]|uniref:Lipoprotein n=1 Tax=Dyella lutea TaxID=2950441 RepID=A0ABT1F6J3_9GAMM|nr:hypothetical protein [Dyella lutea]MCP1373001.1 hypothetical protein [Dyella lutea]
MKTSARHLLLCSLAASGALLLGACGKHDNTTPAPAPASTAATAPMTPMSPLPVPAATAPAPASTAAPAPAGSSAPANAGTTAAATPAVDNAFGIDQVVIGDAVNSGHAVTAPKDSIAADHKAIYASVETRGKTDGVTLSARWSYLEGKGQLVSAISQSIATDGPAVTTFKIQNPHLWPAGKYQVEIALDGKPVSTRAFEVKSPG